MPGAGGALRRIFAEPGKIFPGKTAEMAEATFVGDLGDGAIRALPQKPRTRLFESHIVQKANGTRVSKSAEMVEQGACRHARDARNIEQRHRFGEMLINKALRLSDCRRRNAARSETFDHPVRMAFQKQAEQKLFIFDRGARIAAHEVERRAIREQRLQQPDPGRECGPVEIDIGTQAETAFAGV